jgi:hypothetical protein
MKLERKAARFLRLYGGLLDCYVHEWEEDIEEKFLVPRNKELELEMIDDLIILLTKLRSKLEEEGGE